MIYPSISELSLDVYAYLYQEMYEQLGMIQVIHDGKIVGIAYEGD